MIDVAPNNPYGLTLRSPVLAAAGCFGYGVEYARLVDLRRAGAIVTRSTTLQARRADRPQVRETPAGLFSIGPWPNPGLRRVIERHAPVWAGWETPVILSIAGATAGEYGQIAEQIEGVEGIAALELNLLDEPARALASITAARRATHLPLLAKLPPLDAAPLAELSVAAVAAGADALVICPWLLALQTDPQSGAPIEGRLSGPAIQPLALRLVAAVAAAVADVPLIGGGGIASIADARQFLAAGATAVQVGAALLAEPHLLAQLGVALDAQT